MTWLPSGHVRAILPLVEETAEAERRMSIFVSYRRLDAASAAGRVSDALKGIYGDQFSFLDVTGLRPGEELNRRIQEQLRRVHVVVVIIGPHWKKGLENPEDWVRIELLAARTYRKHILPVLVDRAVMPHQKELPGELDWLPNLLAISLYEDQWDAGFKRLVDAINAVPLQVDPEKRREIDDYLSFKIQRHDRFTTILRWARDSLFLLSVLASVLAVSLDGWPWLEGTPAVLLASLYVLAIPRRHTWHGQVASQARQDRETLRAGGDPDAVRRRFSVYLAEMERRWFEGDGW